MRSAKWILTCAMLVSAWQSACGQEYSVQVSTEKAMREATWRITASWDNGVSGSYDITFRDNGTFVTNSYGGRWFQIGTKYVWAFNGVSGVPDWSIAYAGDVTSSGTTLNGIQGWSHTSGRPKGVHSGVRAFEFVEVATQLKETSPAVVTGQAAKK